MRRITRQKRHRQSSKVRFFIFLSGGLLTAVLLVLALIWLEDRSLGKRPSLLQMKNDQSEIPVERPGEFIFYEALKQSNPDGSDLMPLIPNPEEPKLSDKPLDPKPTKQKQSRRSPAPVGTSAPSPDSSIKKKAKTYTVQVAAFKERTEAEALAGRLTQKGYPAFLVSEDVPGKGLWYRVRIGHYREKEQARQMANRVSKNEKMSGFVAIEMKAIN